MFIFIKYSNWHYISLCITIVIVIAITIALFWFNKRVTKKRNINKKIILIKLELARAYIEAGKYELAKDILENISEVGGFIQRTEANILLNKLKNNFFEK